MAGKAFNDLKLAGRVRTKALKMIEDVLDDVEHAKHSKEYQEQVLLKLAGTVLPRLNEHSGDGGSPISIAIVNYGESDNIHSAIQLQSGGAPPSSPAIDGAVQDDRVAPEGAKNDNGVE